MAIQMQKLFILSIVVQILIQATVVECKFGSFLGGLAGSVVGKFIKGKKTEHHYYYGTPQTTFERRETLANGCYKQVVKEPDTYNPGRYIETEQLICPPIGQAPVVGAPVQQVVGMQQPMAPMAGGGMQQPMAPLVGGGMQQPMAPMAGGGNVMVLSKKTGSYFENSGNSLLHAGSLVLVLAGIVAYFL